MEKDFSYLDDQKAEILGKLERLRNKKKMPVAKVAASLGKSPSYYSVALNRGRALTVESLAKIAAAGIPIACSRKQVGDMAERVASQLNIAVVQPGKQPCIYGAKHRVIDFHQEGGVR